MKKITYLILTILLLLINFSYADNNKIDSLKKELKNSDTYNRIKILNMLSEKFQEANPDKAINYAQEAYNLAIKQNDTIIIANSLLNIGIGYYYKKDYNISKTTLLKSFALFKSQKEINIGIVKNCHFIGKTYYETNNQDKANFYFGKCIMFSRKIKNDEYFSKSFFFIGLISEKNGLYNGAFNAFRVVQKKSKLIKNKKLIALSVYGLGRIYYKWSNYEEALKYYFESLKIEKELDSKKDISSVLNNIGNVYNQLKNYDKALEFYNKSLKINIEENNKRAIIKSYNNIAVVYKNMNDSVNELKYFKKALSIKIELNDTYSISLVLSNIGEFYYDKKQYKKSIDYYNRALKLINKQLNKNDLANTYNRLANSYFALEKHNLAFEYYLKSLEIAKSKKRIKIVKKNYKDLSESYFSINKYKKAYQYLTIYSQIKDSIFCNNTRNSFTGMQNQIQFESDKKAIEILREQKVSNKIDLEKKKKQLKTYKIILGISFFSLFVIIIFTLFLLKGKKKIN